MKEYNMEYVDYGLLVCSSNIHCSNLRVLVNRSQVRKEMSCTTV